MGLSWPGSNDNEGVLNIPQSSKTGLVSYPLVEWGSYPSAKMQSVYSTAPVDWATFGVETHDKSELKKKS